MHRFISESSIPFHWFTCYFCTNTMLFLLQWLSSLIWNQEFWHFQHCYFCIGLLWLFLFCFHMNFRIFSFCGKNILMGDFTEPLDYFW
jgi:hypothetical protein